MSAIVIFLALVAAVAGWWLSRQRLMSKPWLEAGPVTAFPGTEAPLMHPAKIGLGVFLAVVGTLFALLISAYFMRMVYSDWQPAPVPRVLWLNTAMLGWASVALQGAVSAAHKRQIGNLRLALLTCALASAGFLAGQLLAWRDFAAQGYFATSNPAASFFYLLTAMHGLHIVGGLVALGRVNVRAWQGSRSEGLVLSTELCAMYWHVLLVVWLALFSVLMGWAADLIDICRGLLT
ncbi:cytochrome c oxidase subunit 3 [Mesorhizobium sp. VK25A]|uniref:Cytochrome c oxidase subunit 3 n=1 Tax=Mesorhizobium vachelliae TaxID=3072309 RepID=A0ABU5A493_9HYPH|nr:MULTISPECIES: cytochrome c oxidase subunit 3 [unclassified Mesorhizobium]MDX8532518.1 cytochrome c oxidase subunit 3 [Mesorhizobium sp. VK25D]MDX8547836.1 cytochrome c oxidase subunit 3 [Mesorhizobium sp. VK25A]